MQNLPDTAALFTTYTTAAHEDDNERLEPTRNTNNPHQTNEQDDSKDVLNAWEVDTKNGTKLPRLSHKHYVIQAIICWLILKKYNAFYFTANIVINYDP